MGFINTVTFITNHPLNRNEKIKALGRFLKWQITTKLNPFPILYPFTEKSKLIIKKGMRGATGNLYCGLHDFQDMGFLLHFLRKEDLFIDIGANIGSYTILAGAEIKAKTISVEPVPSTFVHLQNNIAVNEIEGNVTAMNIALGAENGIISFTNTLDTVNHVATDTESDTIKVSIKTLDNLLVGNQTPILLKIDVEGYETEVLNGAKDTLKNSGLKAIIIELNGSGKRYGYDEEQIHESLLATGFSPYIYEPFSKKLQLTGTFGKFNTIYLRDLKFIEDRLKTAPKINIGSKSI